MRIAIAILLFFAACADAGPASDGACQARELDCGADVYVGYACSGSARPDESPTYAQGVPEGRVCAEHGARAPDGQQLYCCTARTTSCAYDPAASCDAGNHGFQCRGANRPDALNAALRCGNGVRQGDLIDYCCSASPQDPGCLQSDAVSCSPRLSGWTCRGDSLPRSEQLGASKSRSDFYRLLCSSPVPAANPDYNNYCCFPPAPLPEGGSCVQHTAVPDCAPGRFGFACYGTDRPQDNYLPMQCPEPGRPGLSREGYPATLYCCDFP